MQMGVPNGKSAMTPEEKAHHDALFPPVAKAPEPDADVPAAKPKKGKASKHDE